MVQTTVTKVSTKGQVVIPKELRKEMKIGVADEFLMYGEKDTIIMKKIVRPSLKKSFKELTKKLKKVVKEKKFTRNDLDNLIKDVRASQ